MAEFNAGVLAYAGGERTLLVTKSAVVTVKVCMTLGGYEKGEKVFHDTKRTLNYQ